MKNYDETIASVFERIEKHNTQRQRRIATLQRATVAVGCICLAVLVGSVIRNTLPQMPLEDSTGEMFPHSSEASSAESSGDESSRHNAEASQDSKDESSQSSEPQTSQQVIENSGTVTSPAVVDNINFVTSEDILDLSRAKQNINLHLGDFIEMTPAEINVYYGTDIFPDNIPDDLTEVDQAFGIYRRNGGKGEVYWGTNQIWYTNEDVTREISISVDKDTLPFDFCGIFAAVDSFSVINGTKVGLAQSRSGEFLFAEFTYQEVGFRIIASGVTQDEFIAVVRSLLD